MKFADSLCNGEEQVLSRWNMIEQSLTVSRRQCTVQCIDGCATLISMGRSPTLWREHAASPWCTVSNGESLILAEGHQLSLDCNDPDAAVFTVEDALRDGSVRRDSYWNSY